MADTGFSMTKELGRNIRKRRKELGLTQEELAEKLGIGHQSLSRIEQGVMAPKMDRLPLIAKSLKCTVADLFRTEKDNSASYSARLDDLLTGLSHKKQEFLYQHIAGLVFMLKLDE